MKTKFNSSRRRGAQRGSAVVVIMTLLAIMLMLITVNVASVRTLSRELKLLDRKQQHYWQPREGKP